MIYETIQNFPIDVEQTDVTLRAVNVVGIQESPYSLAREVQVFGGARWELEITLRQTTRDTAQRIEAFLLSLRGRAGRFRLADPYRSLPMGTALGNPIVTTATAGAEVIQSRGWTPSRNGLLRAGDHIEVDMHLHMVLEDVNSDATGAAAITVWPALRETSDEYTPIITRNARGVFALDTNSMDFTRNTDMLNGAVIRAVEVVATKPPLNARMIAGFGDSISAYGSSYDFGVFITSSNYGVRYLIRASIPHSETYSVTHVNPGGTGPLSVNMVGTALTVTLARASGAVTSTNADVMTAVIAAYGNIFIVSTFEDSSGPHLAPVAAQTWGRPGSYNTPRGLLVWLSIFLRQRFDHARRVTQSGFQYPASKEGAWDFGNPGNTAGALLQNPGPLGDLLDAVWDLALVCAGENDLLAGASASAIRDAIVAIWDALVAAGRPFVALELPPSGNPALQVVVDQVNALLRPIAGVRGLKLFRWKSSFVAGGSALPLYFFDGVHPTDLGYFEQAAYMLEQGFESLVQPSEPDYSHPADGSWITFNPGMNGDAAGLATGWTNNSPANLTPSKVGADDGLGDWQRIAGAQGGSYNELQISSTVATTGWAVGDVVEGVAEIRSMLAGWDIKAVMISVYFHGTAGFLNALNSFQGADEFTVGKAFSGVVRTPPGVIPHGCTGVSIGLRVFGSGVLDARNFGVRFSKQA